MKWHSLLLEYHWLAEREGRGDFIEALTWLLRGRGRDQETVAVWPFVTHSRTAVPPSDTVTSSGVVIRRGGG